MAADLVGEGVFGLVRAMRAGQRAAGVGGGTVRARDGLGRGGGHDDSGEGEESANSCTRAGRYRALIEINYLRLRGRLLGLCLEWGTEDGKEKNKNPVFACSREMASTNVRAIVELQTPCAVEVYEKEQ